MRLHAITFLIVSIIIGLILYILNSPELLELGSIILILWVVIRLYKMVYKSVKNIFGK
jgi:hypothetical protein